MEMEKKKSKLTQKNKMEEVINIFNETWRLASFNQPKKCHKIKQFQQSIPKIKEKNSKYKKTKNEN